MYFKRLNINMYETNSDFVGERFFAEDLHELFTERQIEDAKDALYEKDGNVCVGEDGKIYAVMFAYSRFHGDLPLCWIEITSGADSIPDCSGWTIREECLDSWGADDPSYVITKDELLRLAAGWGKTPIELLADLEEVAE